MRYLAISDNTSSPLNIILYLIPIIHKTIQIPFRIVNRIIVGCFLFNMRRICHITVILHHPHKVLLCVATGIC